MSDYVAYKGTIGPGSQSSRYLDEIKAGLLEMALQSGKTEAEAIIDSNCKGVQWWEAWNQANPRATISAAFQAFRAAIENEDPAVNRAWLKVIICFFNKGLSKEDLHAFLRLAYPTDVSFFKAQELMNFTAEDEELIRQKTVSVKRR